MAHTSKSRTEADTTCNNFTKACVEGRRGCSWHAPDSPHAFKGPQPKPNPHCSRLKLPPPASAFGSSEQVCAECVANDRGVANATWSP
eukprot:15467566-Alexandrium_andersonii.AAC.1